MDGLGGRNGSSTNCVGCEGNGMIAIYSKDGLKWDSTLYEVLLPAGCRTPLGLTPLQRISTAAPHHHHGSNAHADDDDVDGASVSMALFYTTTQDHRPFCYARGADTGACERWEALFTVEMTLDLRHRPTPLLPSGDRQ